MVAFTLGYIDSQNQFIAFTNTTVFSNEISDCKIRNSSIHSYKFLIFFKMHFLVYYVNKEPSEISMLYKYFFDFQ